MRGAIGAFCVAVAALLAGAAQAAAADSIGASFFYNAGTATAGINVKNESPSATLTSVDFVTPAGTTISGTPSGGGSCQVSGGIHATCTFNPGAAPNKQVFILANLSGNAPSSFDVAADFSDGGSAIATAHACPAPGSISASPATLPNGTVGQPYSEPFSGFGGTGPYTFDFQGASVPGVPLLPSGLFAGTPTDDGTFAFQLIVSDTNGCTGGLGESVTIEKASSGPTPLSVEDSLPNAEESKPYSQQIQISGGTAPYTVTLVSGPGGLAVTPQGLVHGTPTEAGLRFITVHVRDARGQIESKQIAIDIALPPIPPELLDGLAKLDREFTQVLDDVTGSHEVTTDMLHQIERLADHKAQLVHQALGGTIHGIPARTWFQQLERIDESLHSAEAVDYWASQLRRVAPAFEPHYNAVALYFLKEARSRKQKLEDLVRGKQGRDVPQGFKQGLRDMDRRLNAIIHEERPRLGPHELSGIEQQIKELEAEKLRLIKRHLDWGVFAAPRHVFTFDELFVAFDTIDGDLSEAMVDGIAANNLPTAHAGRHQLIVRLKLAENAKQSIEDKLNAANMPR